VDGNDVLAMYHTAQQAVQQARQGAGPTLIIANTYRIMGHTIGDPLDYRRKDEVEQWQTDEKDPILRFEKWLIQHNFFSAADLETSKSEAQELIQQAAQFALQSPEPALSALWENVYA
jgi:pyruvate dehydrogenase E1 component alpha subunit